MSATVHDISQKVLAIVRGHRLAGGLVWYRVLVVAALIASVGITWPLWQPRQTPPLLPLVNLPQLALGPLLVAACLVSLVLPRAGAIAVTVLIGYGMAVDQTRMQPEFFSLPLLLWGTLPNPSAQLIARAHLIALWFYAGLHKLLSQDYLAGTGPRLVRALPLPMPEALVGLTAVAIAALEIATALAAIFPPTRRVAAWSALALHAGGLVVLSPLSALSNEAVWPWNAVLGLSGFALIAPWQDDLFTSIGTTPWPSRAIAVLLLVNPAGYYAGVVDAYLAHHLYSAATARASVSCPAECRPEQDLNATRQAFRVPLPPEPRLFREVFQATCAPGDRLRIVDPFPSPWGDEGAVDIDGCRAGSLPASHP